MPSRIDKSVTKHLNYGTQTALLSALRLLGLIDEQDVPTDRLNALAHLDAASDQWKMHLRNALTAAYPLFLDGKIDLSRATPGQLEEALKQEFKISGSTIDKVITFFVSGAPDAGLKISAHLQNRKPVVSRLTGGANGRRKRTKSASPLKEESPAPHDNSTPPPPVKTDHLGTLLGKFPQFDPGWPDEIKAQWFKGFDSLMGTVKPAIGGGENPE